MLWQRFEYYWQSFFFFSVIAEEAIDSRAEVKSFDKSSLKHVETEEKKNLPTAQGKSYGQFISKAQNFH